MKVIPLTDYVCGIVHGPISVIVERNPRKHTDAYAIWGTRGLLLRVKVDKVPSWRFHPKRGLYV